MRAKEIITEIEKIYKSDYVGGKGSLDVSANLNRTKPLPGGSGMVYRTDDNGMRLKIEIIDPKPKNFVGRLGEHGLPIGKLELLKYKNGPFKNAYQVNTITTNEDYRGGGYALALYGIALSILKVTLISGSSQTPGGRKNWLNLASIPGVEVKGAVALGDYELATNKNDYDSPYMQAVGKRENQQAEERIDYIMQTGAQYLGDGGGHKWFAFDVVGGNGELAPAVKNALTQIYNGKRYDPMLYAQWTGS